MKKFMTLAAMFAAVMVSFTACDENTTDPTPTPGEEVCADCGKNPCECEAAYESPIKIDGDFADWDALDASKVASATCHADALNTALKSVKVYADAVYINFLIEVDTTHETLVEGGIDLPIDIYLNADNSENSVSSDWSNQASQDAIIEGCYVTADDGVVSFDPGCYPYTGTEEAVEWAWDVANPLIAEGTGFGQGAGTVGKYEFSLLTELLIDAVDLQDTFGMGITVSPGWDIAGLLPNGPVTEDNTKGAVPFMLVTINR